jgi:hypothetical protein
MPRRSGFLILLTFTGRVGMREAVVTAGKDCRRPDWHGMSAERANASLPKDGRGNILAPTRLPHSASHEHRTCQRVDGIRALDDGDEFVASVTRAAGIAVVEETSPGWQTAAGRGT